MFVEQCTGPENTGAGAGCFANGHITQAQLYPRPWVQVWVRTQSSFHFWSTYCQGYCRRSQDRAFM